MAAWVTVMAMVGTPAHAGTDAAVDSGTVLDNGFQHSPSDQVASGPVLADFEGHKIDLAGDWGDAQACLIWRQGGVVECFRTAKAMEHRAKQLAPKRDAEAASTGGARALSSFSCSSSLSLYSYGGYWGRQVSFWDRGYWQNLGDYGFDDQASSYIVGGCYVHLAEYAYGGGWWYPGDTSPYHGEPWMYSSWDNRVSSIYIE